MRPEVQKKIEEMIWRVCEEYASEFDYSMTNSHILGMKLEMENTSNPWAEQAETLYEALNTIISSGNFVYDDQTVRDAEKSMFSYEQFIKGGEL